MSDSDMFEEIKRAVDKMGRLLPKGSRPIRKTFSIAQLRTWRSLLDFSRYKLESYGSRQNQLRCEKNGGRVGTHDKRHLGSHIWISSIFLHSYESYTRKKKDGDDEVTYNVYVGVLPEDIPWPDSRSLALQCLQIVIDITAEFGDDIYSSQCLNDAVKTMLGLMRFHKVILSDTADELLDHFPALANVLEDSQTKIDEL